jgi:hypothetical protein
LQLHLGPDHIAGRPGVDLDAGQRGRNHEIPERFGLRRNVGARQVVAALPEDLLEHHALLIAGQVAVVGDVGARKVLFEEDAVSLDAGIVVPFRVVGILVGRANNDAHRIVQAGGLQGSRDRAGRKVDDDHRLPADLGGPADRLRGKLRRSRDEQCIRSRALQADDL